MPPLEAYRRSLLYSYAPGLFPTLEALKRRPACVRRLLVAGNAAQGEALDRARAICADRGIRIEQADRVLARISGKENCYAAAVFDKWEDRLSAGRRHLVLHRPADRGNAGSILRSALGFGFLDIAFIRPCTDPFHPELVRACMGALFSLRIREYASMEAYQTEHPGRTLVPFMLSGTLTPEEAAGRLSPPYSLVMGNEAEGLPEAFAALGQPVRIPHNGEIDSLNLSVAAAIGMYAFTKAEEARGGA